MAGQTCLVVEGAYRVYFEQGAVGINDAMQSMNAQLEEGMGEGVFEGDNIVQVTWKENLDDPNTDDTPSGAESPTVPSGSTVSNSNAPAIIGASVGGILALGMVALYRRRNLKATDDDTFTTPSGVNSGV